MNPDEKRGYSKGYRAGKKRLEKEHQRAQIQRLKNQFYNDALLAALSGCVDTRNWKDGNGKPINTLNERVALADKFAVQALKYWRCTA